MLSSGSSNSDRRLVSSGDAEDLLIASPGDESLNPTSVITDDTDMKLHTGSVAGSPTVWLETDEPTLVGITFRVGITDEPQKQRGVTRLLVELMNHSLGGEARCLVGNLRTDICYDSASGHYLSRVSEWLADPDFGQLREVRDRLGADLAPISIAGEHFGIRFGNIGPGRQGVPELGLSWLTEKQLRKWLSTYFNADNACLFSVGPTPVSAEVHLSDRISRPLRVEPSKGPWDRPQWVPSSDPNIVSLSMVLADRPESVIVRNLLELTADRCLNDHNIDHSAPVSSFDSIGNDVGQLVLSVRTANPTAALAELRNLLSTLALTVCEDADLESAIHEAIRRDNEPAGMLAYATRASLNHLLDRPTVLPVKRSELYSTYSPTRIAGLLQEAWPTLVWQTGSKNRPSPIVENGARPDGEAYSHIGHPENEELTVGASGLTYRNGSDVTAVEWSDVEAVVHTGEFGRRLYAKDGPPLSVESTEWERGSDLIGSIDESLPRSRHIDAG